MNALLKDELRAGWLGVPKAYTLYDFLGFGLGAYFIYAAVAPMRYRPPAWVNIMLGGAMIYIHSQRFFYAPQTRDGLRKLLTALDIKPDDICTL